MKNSESPTMEQVLLERMGVSIDDAVATGADFIDERAAAAAEEGIDLEQRLGSLADLLRDLSEPQNIAALRMLVANLPQLAEIVSAAGEIKNLVATVADVVDDYQQRYEADGIDIERAMTNGIQAALLLGNKIDPDHLARIGDLLDSDILNSNAVGVVDNAARSLTHAQENVCESPQSGRIGLFGLLMAMRKPELQRSLAFAVQFGRCFGRNLEEGGAPAGNQS